MSLPLAVDDDDVIRFSTEPRQTASVKDYFEAICRNRGLRSGKARAKNLPTSKNAISKKAAKVRS
jgi:hypothetical protein